MTTPKIAIAAAAATAAALLYLYRRRNRCQTVKAFYLMHAKDDDELPFIEAASLPPDVELKVEVSDGVPALDEAFYRANKDVNVFITRLPTKEALDAWPHSLKKGINPFAGPVESTRQLIRERPHLTLHNAHFNAQPTAELALGLLLAAAKCIVVRDKDFREEAFQADSKMWTPGFMFADEPPTLGGRNALILGYGAIGSRVAAMLHGMGMQVHACRRNAGNKPTFDGVATVHELSSSLHTLLPTVHVLMICLPGTKATDGLIGQKELKLLPKGALLVNVGRGSVVDERALYESLAGGHLGGAGVDVWYRYPMLPGTGMGGGDSKHLGPSSADCPFHKLPNCVMSPHRGQSSDGKAKDRVAELVWMLSQYSSTGVMPNAFDVDRGY